MIFCDSIWTCAWFHMVFAVVIKTSKTFYKVALNFLWLWTEKLNCSQSNQSYGAVFFMWCCSCYSESEAVRGQVGGSREERGEGMCDFLAQEKKRLQHHTAVSNRNIPKRQMPPFFL